MTLPSQRRVRRTLLAAMAALALPAAAVAQHGAPTPAAGRTHRGGSWKRFAAGFVTSILAHEGGHIVASLAQGAHPTFGLNRGRPTVYSGIDWHVHPHKQFLFSSAGLDVQALVDEGILDDPHHGGGPFQRGVLAGGIATTAFYLTLGRCGSVSDIEFMRRTSGLTSTQIALIYGGVALMHIIRIARDGRFAHFFVLPGTHHDLRLGVALR